MPYVSDFIDHVFFYAHHMETVHYENGKYHVHYQTAKEAKEESSDKSATNSLKKGNDVSDHIIAVVKPTAFVSGFLNKDYALTASPFLVSSLVQNNFPPPRS